jgi:hypothetical protein
MNCNHTSSELSGHQLCIYNDGVAEGKQVEYERISDLVERLPFIWMGDKRHLYVDKKELSKLIELTK